MVDMKRLDGKLTTEEKKENNVKHLLVSVAKGVFLLVLGALNAHAPIVSAIIIATGVIDFFVKRSENLQEKQWKESVASMMKKYRAILENAQDKEKRKQIFEEGIADIRKQSEYDLELKADKTVAARCKIAGGKTTKEVKVSKGDLLRLKVYCINVLNYGFPERTFSDDDLAKVFIEVQENIELFYNDTNFIHTYESSLVATDLEKVKSILENPKRSDPVANIPCKNFPIYFGSMQVYHWLT